MTPREKYRRALKESRWRSWHVRVTLLALFLAGCYHAPRPDNGPEPVPPAALADVAEQCVRDKYSRMAEAARKVAEKVKAGEFKDYAELHDFEKTLNDATMEAYQPLRDAQTARLTKDGEGAFDLKPADAAVWEETAAGFERIAGKAKAAPARVHPNDLPRDRTRPAWARRD